MSGSSIGTIAGGLIGGLLGFFVPVVGVAIGFSIGATLGGAIGGFIDAPKQPEVVGPRLSDLSVQTSTYGSFIPRVYGVIAIYGNIFWIENNQIKETSKKVSQGGKGMGGGGATTKTYSYSATFALGLCEGPIDGVKRIWIGNKLWYDASTSTLEEIIAAQEMAQYFTLYLGTDTQEANPRMQATLGAANVPAYRGLAYIVFYDLPLKDYGNSLQSTQIKVEIVKNGSNAYVITNGNLNGGLSWRGSDSNDDIYVAVGTTMSATSFNGRDWLLHPIEVADWSDVAWNGSVFCAVADGFSSRVALSTNGYTWEYYDIDAATARACVAWGNGVFFSPGWATSRGYYSADGRTWTRVPLPVLSSWSAVEYNGSVFCCISSTVSTNVITSSDGIEWTLGSMPTALNWLDLAWNGEIFLAVADSTAATAFATSPDGVVWTTRTPPAAVGWTSVTWNGEYFFVTSYPSVVAAISPDGITWETIPVPNYFWKTSFGSGFFGAIANNGETLLVIDPFTPDTTILGDIVETECLTSNFLTAADVDRTELTDIVRGYRISELAAIRGGIDPLRTAWPFDAIQSGYQIYFKRRGSASVATIDSSLLDARTAGAQDGVIISQSREMDAILPRKVLIKYFDVTREYDVNEQYIERINTDAVNESIIDLPIVFNADEAARKAEVLLYLYWIERNDLLFKLPPIYSQLEPGDVITITGDNADYEARLTAIDYTADGRLECKAKYNKAILYTAVAEGEEGQSTGVTLTLKGPSVYELLDIPMLQDVYDKPGLPVAMTGYLPDWPGGVIYRSTDNGQSWTDVQGFEAPGSTIGYATDSLSTHTGTVLDKSSRLTIMLYQGSISSVTEQQMFQGQNWFAYGRDGAWEIIACQNADLQSDDSYILSDFLRGQMGTEWATGLHAANDKIIHLDSDELEFLTMDSGDIGVSYTYRGITLGKTIDSDGDKSFSYDAVNLECLSPCHATGSRHPTTNAWTITWVRRSRYAGWRNLVDTPLGESSESYEIDIYSNPTFTTIKRTITATSQTAQYTSAQQVTDFGSNQSTIYVKIYQLSALVGRGYALTATLTRS